MVDCLGIQVHECTRGCILNSRLNNSRLCGSYSTISSRRQDGGICVCLHVTHFTMLSYQTSSSIDHDVHIIFQRVNCSGECGGPGMLSCDNPDLHDPWLHPWCGLECHVSLKFSNYSICTKYTMNLVTRYYQGLYIILQMDWKCYIIALAKYQQLATVITSRSLSGNIWLHCLMVPYGRLLLSLSSLP